MSIEYKIERVINSVYEFYQLLQYCVEQCKDAPKEDYHIYLFHCLYTSGLKTICNRIANLIRKIERDLRESEEEEEVSEESQTLESSSQ